MTIVANILISDKVSEVLIDLLRREGFNIEYRADIERKDLLEIIDKYHALVFRSRTRVDREIIRRGINLKILLRIGRGLDNIDVKAAEEMGIKVYNTPDAPTHSTAELTIALMLICARNLYTAINNLKNGVWIKSQGLELYGKNLCIIGFGRIGSRVAEIARGLGMKIYTYDVRDVGERAKRIGVEYVDSLDKLIPVCDVITIHVDLNNSSENMVNREFLERVKNGCILINTSRGKVIDPEALLEYLNRGRIMCAGLDVFINEPPKQGTAEYELINHPRVVATPHIGFQTMEAQYRAAVEAARILIREFKGG